MLLGGAMALVSSAYVEAWNPVPITDFQPFLECKSAAAFPEYP